MRYPIGIQSFEKIRKGGYVYVDKSDLVHKLAEGSVYFLARPRRFGKSLLIDTLRCYFEGRRDLFEGLLLGFLEPKWEQFPVFVFDFNLVKSYDREFHTYRLDYPNKEVRHGLMALLANSYLQKDRNHRGVEG